ncbi:MAG: TonB family protein [Cyclobacteriaceae bacterium]
MKKNSNLDFTLSRAGANEFKKHQHLSLSQLRGHLNNETSGQQKHVIDEHILRCDRCRPIWDGLVHFSEKHKNSNILSAVETGLRKLIATQGLTALGLKGLLGLIAIAISLGLVTYDFEEDRVSAFANFQATQIPKVSTKPAVVSIVPVIDLVKQDSIYLSSAIRTMMLEDNQPAPEMDLNDVAMEPEIIDASLATSSPKSKTPNEPIAVKEKVTPTETPLQDNPEQNNVANPITSKATLKTISGVVVSEEGRTPLAGVKVTIPGLSVRVFTDEEGSYRIGVPIEKKNLVFDYKNAQVLQPLDSINQMVNVTMPMLKAVREKELNISPYPITSEAYYKTYLKHNLKYPARALRNNIAGTVIVAFTVEVDGSLTNQRVSQSLGYGCDKEAIRLLTEGPDWQPALVNGEPVPKEAILLVSFKQ